MSPFFFSDSILLMIVLGNSIRFDATELVELEKLAGDAPFESVTCLDDIHALVKGLQSEAHSPEQQLLAGLLAAKVNSFLRVHDLEECDPIKHLSRKPLKLV